MNAHGAGAAWTCRDFGRLLGAYADGELDATSMTEVEGHVTSCECCRERLALQGATRASLKRALQQPAPDGLRARMAVALSAAQARGDARPPVAPRRLGFLRHFVPVASAAAAGLFVFVAVRSTIGRPTHPVPDDLIAQLVSEHARPLPPERTDPKDVRQFEQYVGVPVHPARLVKTGARLVGGRMIPLHEERTAMLQYEIGHGSEARRVSVIIFDPRRIQVNDESLVARSVGTSQVQVGRSRGYSVAVTQRDGVGYALASDLDPERNAQLVAYTGDE